MLDLLELAIFVRAVEGRSLSAAAQALRLPRSTVTRRLAQLEDRLGTQLLHRSTRSMSLTPAGEAFYPRAARLVAEAQLAWEEVTEGITEPRGRLRVTAPVEFGDSLMFGLCVEFLRRYPEVHLEMDLSNRLVDLIGEGFDLAIRAGRLADSSLLARKLCTVQHRLFASSAYLGRNGLPQSPHDLEHHAVVALARPSGPLHWDLQRGRDQVQVPLHPRLVVNHLPAVRDAVLAGVGIGPLPATQEEGSAAPRHPDLRPVLQEWSFPAAGIYAVTPAHRHPRAAVQRFVELVQERLQHGLSLV
jgi:DNA-binding transcriptional LysR family regulator